MVRLLASSRIASIKSFGDRVLSSRDDVAVIAAMYVLYDGGIEPKMMDVNPYQELICPSMQGPHALLAAYSGELEHH
jgi:hypothetical protein